MLLLLVSHIMPVLLLLLLCQSTTQALMNAMNTTVSLQSENAALRAEAAALRAGVEKRDAAIAELTEALADREAQLTSAHLVRGQQLPRSGCVITPILYV